MKLLSTHKKTACGKQYDFNTIKTINAFRLMALDLAKCSEKPDHAFWLGSALRKKLAKKYWINPQSTGELTVIFL